MRRDLTTRSIILEMRNVHLSRGQLTTPEYVAPESRD